MKIGIMTFFRPINYGAYLQAYALSHRLNQEEDIEAEIIDFHMPAEDNMYALKFEKNILRMFYNHRKSRTFRRALSKQILSEENECGEVDEFIRFADDKYDIIIAGSDEIWMVDGYRGFPTPYFLPGDLHCVKVSYAASGRTPFSVLSAQNQVRLQKYLEDFAYIGVRDNKTREEIAGLLPGRDPCVNFDPSFVFDFKPNAEKGRALLKKYFNIHAREKVVALMYLEGSGESPNLIRYLKKRYGRECTFISLFDWNVRLQSSPYVSPLEWIDVIAAVDGVITMFYHGVCFSVIAGTPFFAVDKLSPNDEESKLHDLLTRLNLSDQYSLGVQPVIEENKLDGFMSDVKKGRRDDPSGVLKKARAEFAQFIDVLRQLYKKKI